MKQEYDFSQGKRGAIDPTPPRKTLITVGLDDDILQWFRSQVHPANGGNYQTFIEHALREHIQHRSDLSEVENKTNEELNFVFDLFTRIIATPKNNNQTKTSLREQVSILCKHTAPTIWEKAFLIGFALFFVFAYVASLINSGTILSVPGKVVYILISIIFLYLFTIVNFFRTIKQQKSSEEIIQSKLEKARKEAAGDLRSVNDLYKNTSQPSLILAEAKLKYLIEESQIRAKTAYIFLPILVLVIVASFIYVLGIFVKPLGNNLLYGTVIGVPGLITVSRSITEFIVESGSQSQIIKFKRCLSLLEQAQILANSIEIKNVAQSKKIGTLSQQLDDPAFPDITYRRGASGQPLPVLRGTSLRVQTVVLASQQWDLSPNQIAAEYELTETQVNQALAFYAKYTEEIDMAIAAEQTLEAANV